YGPIFGLLGIGNSLGSAAGPRLSGAIFDRTHSYLALYLPPLCFALPGIRAPGVFLLTPPPSSSPRALYQPRPRDPARGRGGRVAAGGGCAPAEWDPPRPARSPQGCDSGERVTKHERPSPDDGTRPSRAPHAREQSR